MVGNLEPKFTRIILKQMTEYVTLEIRSTGEAKENQVENYFGAPFRSSFCVNIVVLTTNSTEAFFESVTKESRHRHLQMIFKSPAIHPYGHRPETHNGYDLRFYSNSVQNVQRVKGARHFRYKIRERKLRRSYAPKTVCIGWPIAMNLIVAKNLTPHSTFKPLRTTSSVASFPIILGLQKKSKHFESVNSIVGWASDTGHFTKWRQSTMDNLKYTSSQWLKERRNSKLYQGLEKVALEFHHPDTKPFGMENAVLCFTSTIVGSILASLAWVCEIVAFYDTSKFINF
ncbi:unnamed protein product [Allacma fusca]|uniref:Uncharacterized protein n=1 Tax=Allacma fusca TaxID=39272 RepID=A0A8J2KBG5_9HEXA|nr:unnamed protein product [Allacma fusca]